jgi:hypothetical protein
MAWALERLVNLLRVLVVVDDWKRRGLDGRSGRRRGHCGGWKERRKGLARSGKRGSWREARWREGEAKGRERSGGLLEVKRALGKA